MDHHANPNRIALGFGDLHADAGDHIGHFYRTIEEWKELVIPFLRLGLEGDDKCVCVVSQGAPEEELLTSLEAQGIDTRSALSSGQLVVTHGYSEIDALEHLLASSIAEIPGRFRFLRWAGDMTWSHKKMPTSESLMEWESACNVIENAPVVFLCQYELSQFLGSVVVDALKTHPLCIMGSAIHRNPYYEDPEAFLDHIRKRTATPTVPQ